MQTKFIKKSQLPFIVSTTVLLGAGALFLSYKWKLTCGLENHYVSFNTPIDPEQLVSDPRGGVYAVNRVFVNLEDSATHCDAETLTMLVHGKIVGFYPSANIYQLEVPTTTIDELDAVITRLESDSRVESASQNFAMRSPDVLF